MRCCICTVSTRMSRGASSVLQLLLPYAGDAARLLPDASEHLVTMKDAFGRVFDCKLPAAPPNVTGPSTGQSSEVLLAFIIHGAIA